MKVVTMLLVFSLMLLADGQSPAVQETAVVRGVLTDFLTGAGVPHATVVFESAEGTKTVVSAQDGSYEAQLPVDLYRISVRRMTYCSARRAAAFIGSVSDTTLDFILVPCTIQHAKFIVKGRYHTEMALEVSPLDFDSFKLPSSTSAPRELLVRFGMKHSDQRSIDYEGAQIKYLFQDRHSKETRDEFKYVGVMLSYDLLTVYADKVKLGKVSLEIEAEGNVIVEDGNERTKASAVRIRLAGDKPTIDVIR